MQRVRIGTNHSSYSQFNGAIPQGSWLEPVSFLVLINDLRPDCLVHKCVDDTTLTELLYDRTKPFSMQLFFHQLLCWADQNDIVLNLTKTKEMVFGPPSITSKLIYLPFPPALIKYKEPARLNCLVSTLILIFLATLNVETIVSILIFLATLNVETIVSKATQRLYFLKQLKRAGVPHAQLLHFYNFSHLSCPGIYSPCLASPH